MELNQSRIEIEKAKKSLNLMKESKTMLDFESNWRDFLIHLEKAWIKSERECLDFKNRFQPWQGKYVKIRRTDPLLKYLKNARDVDTHSIEEIVDKIPGSRTITTLNKQEPLFAKKLVIKNGEIIEYEGNQPLIIEDKPGRIDAKSFTNQGTIYLPPTYHLGKPLKHSKNPLEIAELGLEFYSKFLDEIEKKF
jgi:hypothetical protein